MKVNTTAIIAHPTWGKVLELLQTKRHVKIDTTSAEEFKKILDEIGLKYTTEEKGILTNFILKPIPKIAEIYEGVEYIIEFATGRPLRYSPKGKHWPITTQCTIKANGLIIGIGEAVKHENDKNNPMYGRVYAAKKAFATAKNRVWVELRERLWKQILEQKD